MTSRLTNEQKDQVAYWIDRVNADLVACISKDKKPIEKWSDNLVGEPDYHARKEQGVYDNGVAIICGQIRRGKYAGYYITCLDFDSKEAFDKFCEIFDKTLEQIANYTRVEWHGDLEKIHIFLISKKPFKNLTAGGLEVKANKLLAFVSPSLHKGDNGPYRAYDSESIVVIDGVEQMWIERIIEMFVTSRTDNTRSYYDNDEKEKYLAYLELDTTILRAGERNPNTLLKACSYFLKRKGEFKDLSDPQRYDKLVTWVNKHQRPTLFEEPGRQNEVPDIWERVCRKYAGERQERLEKRENEDDANHIQSIRDKIKDIGERIMSCHNFVTLAETKEILVYNNGVYVSGGEIEIEKEAERMYDYDLKLKDLTEVKGHIMGRTYHNRSEFDSEINIINLKNGLYNIEKGEFEEHTPTHLSMSQKPIIFNPSVGRHPRKFIQYLKQVVYPSDIWTVIELMAYTFYRDNPFEIITILLGNGGNGKSVEFGILTALHGAGNVSNVSLKTIIERPFGLYDLVGKDCNLNAEMSSGIIQDTSILKKMTGRQLIRVEQKNQKAFDARIYAKEWLNCNTLPNIRSDDQNDAYYRRNVIVGFPNKFEERDYPQTRCKVCGLVIMSEEEKADRLAGIFKLDPDLISKLTTEEELSGIFNLLMLALRGILKNKRISINEKTVQERRQKYEMAANPYIWGFLKVAVDPESKEADATTKETAYLAYQKFCKHYKLAVISNTMFGKRLKQYIRDDRETVLGKTIRVWKGIKLTEDYLQVVPEQETLDAPGISGV